MSNNILKLNGIGDGRGVLVSLEAQRNVPFDIKRVYYLTELKKDQPRGFHAHKSLKQIVVCVHGSCDFILDDGEERKTIRLKSAEEGLLIESMVWREMHNFSEECVLMVLASEYYDENDYIRNYEDFCKLTGK